jgi:hemerythrin-like domain-containing protein
MKLFPREDIMKPRGPLMTEHRLIEKMLAITGKELDAIRKTNTVDPVVIDTIVDFIRTYADRTHHGKEEDILFKQLERKNLDAANKKIMQELVDEHVAARNVVKKLVDANAQYARGEKKSISVIIDTLSFLISFYPVHIAKEDKVFFPDTEKYFSAKELEDMLEEFREFDRKMIHEKYLKLYDSLLRKYSVFI